MFDFGKTVRELARSLGGEVIPLGDADEAVALAFPGFWLANTRGVAAAGLALGGAAAIGAAGSAGGAGPSFFDHLESAAAKAGADAAAREFRNGSGNGSGNSSGR